MRDAAREQDLRCGYAFPLIGGHLVAAGIDSQPSARAGRRGRKVGLGWRFGQRGHGSLVSIPVPPPRKLVGCETAGEGGGWGTAAARGRATDRTPDLGSGRGRGGGGQGKKKRDDRRQARQESGYNETRARWQPRVSVLNAVFAAAADQAVLRSLYPSVHRRVPVRGAKERVNVSLGFGVTRHSRGGSFGLAGVRSIGRLANPARGVGWGRVPCRAIQRVPSQQGGVSVPMLLGPAGGRMSLGRLAAAAVVHFCAGFQCSCP